MKRKKKSKKKRLREESDSKTKKRKGKKRKKKKKKRVGMGELVTLADGRKVRVIIPPKNYFTSKRETPAYHSPVTGTREAAQPHYVYGNNYNPNFEHNAEDVNSVQESPGIDAELQGVRVTRGDITRAASASKRIESQNFGTGGLDPSIATIAREQVMEIKQAKGGRR